MQSTTENKKFAIEMYWEPTIPECGVWERSSDFGGLYTEIEAAEIISRGRRINRGYRKVEVTPEGLNPSIGPACRVTDEGEHGMATITPPFMSPKKPVDTTPESV